MANLEGVKVGDKVTVNLNGEMSVRRVKKVTKTSITDDRAGRWTYPYGRRWGRSHSHSVYCERWEPKHDQQIEDRKRQQHRNKVRNTVIWYEYHSLPEVVLDRLYAILQDHEASQQNTGAETDAARNRA